MLVELDIFFGSGATISAISGTTKIWSKPFIVLHILSSTNFLVLAHFGLIWVYWAHDGSDLLKKCSQIKSSRIKPMLWDVKTSFILTRVREEFIWGFVTILTLRYNDVICRQDNLLLLGASFQCLRILDIL